MSSTYLDLIEERQKAVEGILRAGHIPAGMELFTAASKSQWRVIEGWIKESDVLMLILGGKYGSIETESGKSFTQLEYEFALKHNIPVFALILNDQYLANKKSKDINLKVYEYEVENAQVEKYNSFKGLVKSNLVSFIGDINQISTEVVLSLQDFVRNDESEYKFRGWIRGNDIKIEQVKDSSGSNKLFQMDEAFLNKLINEIESGYFIDTINHIANQCSYESESKMKITEFIYFSQQPSTRFFNQEVQDLYNKLIEKLSEYSSFLSVHFFVRKNVDRLYLYPDLNIDFTHADKEARDRYDYYADKLYEISKDTIKEISDFVHEAKFTLYR